MKLSGWVTLVALPVIGISSTASFVHAPQQRTVKGPQELRVVIASVPERAEIGSAHAWRLVDAWGQTRAHGGNGWRIERRARRLRGATRDGRSTTAWSDEPLALLPDTADELVSWAGRRYRGELRFVATDTAILVLNILALDDYLRGVVPIEIGPRRPDESAAVEAQAIAARSYTIVRAMEGVMREFDLTSRATDQVYGGAEVESAVSDAAIRATSGLVLTFAGRVVRAPYHATCGGTTAAPTEVWQGRGEAYLRSIADRPAGSDRPWCSIAPRYNWERVIDPQSLTEALRRAGRPTDAAAIRMVRAESMTPSGRVAVLAIDTDRGTVRLKGNEMRFALRGVGGEILNSTYFSLEPILKRDGRLEQLTLRGRGNGHGVGMCQWGAIGRARAGMDARAILAAYFPGTELARLQ